MTDVSKPPATTMLAIAETRLGQTPGAWIAERHGHGVSYRAIAAELVTVTGIDPFVSHETIRVWHTRWVNEQIGGAA